MAEPTKAKDDAEPQPGGALFQSAGGEPSGSGRGPFFAIGAAVAAAVVIFAVRSQSGDPPPAPTAQVTATAAPAPLPEGATVKVPGGNFQMGSEDGDPDEKPVTEVNVGAFDIDVTEVTVAAYAKCVTAVKCSAPDTGEHCNWHKAGREAHPINCVDWAQAKDYCAFTGKRLPSEAEWEFAARGADGRRYPWKDGAPAAQLCWNGEGNDLGKGSRQGTCPVGSYRAGASPFGALDMAGNVWEWTSSRYCPYGVPPPRAHALAADAGVGGNTSGDAGSEAQGHDGGVASIECSDEHRVIRGGGWNNLVPGFVRAQDRAKEGPRSRPSNTGFRCARSPA